MLDAGRSCPGTMLLDAAGTVGLARCAAYGAGATLGLAWVGAFRCSNPYEERFQRRSITSFPVAGDARISTIDEPPLPEKAVRALYV